MTNRSKKMEFRLTGLASAYFGRSPFVFSPLPLVLKM